MFITGLLVGLPIGGALGAFILLFLQCASTLNRETSMELSVIPTHNPPVSPSEISAQLCDEPSQSSSVTDFGTSL